MTADIQFDRDQTLCFTGHRTIPERELAAIRKRTGDAVREAFGDGFRTFLCGGARGFDTLAAQEVLRFRQDHPGIRLMIAVPCRAQADRWPLKDQAEYRRILKQADAVIVLSESYYQGCMLNRNRFMVDNAALCICYMTRFEGGTWYTVRYALHQGVLLKNIAVNDCASPVMKELPWNSTSTSLSAKENVNTALLSRFRLTAGRRRNTSGYCSGKQKNGDRNSQNL